MKKKRIPEPEGPLGEQDEAAEVILKALEEEDAGMLRMLEELRVEDEKALEEFLKAIDGEDCQAGRTVETRQGKQ